MKRTISVDAALRDRQLLGSPDGHVLANTEVPSSKVRRDAVHTLPPPTGVSRMRWLLRSVSIMLERVSRETCAR